MLGLDRRSVSTASLAGASLSLGFIELLATPLQDVSELDVRQLAVRTTLFAAPIVVTLLQLLQQGPLLLAESRQLQRLKARAWKLRLLRASGLALCSSVLVLYCVTASVVAALLTKPEADPLQEAILLIGSLDPRPFALMLLKTAVFAAIAALLCLRQGRRVARGRASAARAMSEAIMASTAVLLFLDLLLLLLFDPLRLPGYG